MADLNETRALKASFRGASDTARNLAALSERVEALDDHAEIASDLLDELARVTAAHAVASTAFRGLVMTMQVRRGASASA